MNILRRYLQIGNFWKPTPLPSSGSNGPNSKIHGTNSIFFIQINSIPFTNTWRMYKVPVDVHNVVECLNQLQWSGLWPLIDGRSDVT
jgi:hypothetical protein